ncbi:MAG: PilZ domain-containing protein [Acidobacteria bacterium]|nr:PilZ domain-containing protein [Acidobacteriota bacterium]
MEQRRRARRVSTSIDINWGFTEECPYAGTIIDLTVLGCAIHNREGVEVVPGQIVLIRFWMPHERILKIEVVHQALKGVVGFGAKFLDLTAEESETLEQIVQLFGEPERDKQP